MFTIFELSISNYKSFYNSGPIKLNPKWNVVIGKNNSGKTALADAFKLNPRPLNNPHRSLKHDSIYGNTSLYRFDIVVEYDREWLIDSVIKSGGTVSIPVGGRKSDGSRIQIQSKEFTSRDSGKVKLSILPDSDFIFNWPAHGIFDDVISDKHHATVKFNAEVNDFDLISVSPGSSDWLRSAVESQINQGTFVFDAKRYANGRAPYQDATILASDASNLATCIHKMTANIHLFQEFNEHIRYIFDNSIYGISVDAVGGHFQILVWNVNPEYKRVDLAIPLDQCGSGIGQVLSILYVVMNYTSSVIIIDEPNSFLHPGATKRLIRTLKEYNHQYIITTHSPEVVNDSQPSSIHLTSIRDGVSQVETLDPSAVMSKQLILSEVGASLSDVFSSECVIWVEGPTEKVCFDYIMQKFYPGKMGQFSFVALRNTGDFDGKNATATLEIYDALSSGGALLPTTVAFSFDDEGKSDRQKADLQRRCGSNVHFLPRKMTENFLLNPVAICQLLEILGERGISPQSVREKMIEIAQEQGQLTVSVDLEDESFLKNVHGANLLKTLFQELSESRHAYLKVQHGQELIKFICEHDEEKLRDLITYIGDLLNLSIK